MMWWRESRKESGLPVYLLSPMKISRTGTSMLELLYVWIGKSCVMAQPWTTVRRGRIAPISYPAWYKSRLKEGSAWGECQVSFTVTLKLFSLWTQRCIQRSSMSFKIYSSLVAQLKIQMPMLQTLQWSCIRHYIYYIEVDEHLSTTGSCRQV